MTDTATDWQGVIIRTKATDSKKFVGLVTTALAKIASKPTGALLK
ncbi:MAG: hypothetical protein RQ966_19375 [Acetobacteraceae bacterium]|nr:hypothetical protein [Acetobacteraceae bacterium]